MEPEPLLLLRQKCEWKQFHSALQWTAVLLNCHEQSTGQASLQRKLYQPGKKCMVESGPPAVELRARAKPSGRGVCAKCYLPVHQGSVLHGITYRALEAGWVIGGRWGEIMGLQVCGPTSHSSFPTGGGTCLQSSVLLSCASFYVCHSDWNQSCIFSGYTGSVFFYFAYYLGIRSSPVKKYFEERIFL